MQGASEKKLTWRVVAGRRATPGVGRSRYLERAGVTLGREACAMGVLERGSTGFFLGAPPPVPFGA